MAKGATKIKTEYRPNWLLFGLYEVALLGFLGLFLLALLQSRLVAHATVEHTLDATRAAFRIPAGADLKPGDSVAIYRYHNAWKEPIGSAKVETASAETGVLRFDPNQMKWPMGRHGTITEVHPGTARVNIGQELGLQPLDHLVVFQDRRPVGRLEITKPEPGASSTVVQEAQVPLKPGMVVSEYTVATQVLIEPDSSFRPDWILGALVAVWAGIWLIARRSPFWYLGAALRKLVANRPAFVGRLLDWAVSAFFIRIFTALLCQLLTSATDLPFSRFAEPLWVMVFLAYAYQYRQTSLSAALREMVAFKGGLIAQVPTESRKFAIFAGHLLIAWAFGNSLVTFLRGNLEAVMGHAWPESTSLTFGGFGDRLGYIVSHAPHFATPDDVFATLRYLLWCLTILGCLLGYGHSIFGYLWGKQIRNLDFSVAGWVVNGWCYGPLLGWLVWQTVPSYIGTDPIFGGGFLASYQNVLELLLNVLYTFSIWNLGTKFGVMTDKGVCKSGFYTVARHPSYTLEALMFVTMDLRGLSNHVQWGSILVYVLLYYLRSEREDDFMGKSNPDYADLRAATPWKFVPYVY